MLVSHDHKFIFIKPKKVAGTSIQEYLEPYCKNGIVKRHDPLSHMPATEVREIVGEEIWNSYLKICPMRNPWDKTVSLFHWRKRKRPFYIRLRRLLRGKDWKSPAQIFSFKDFVKFLDKDGKVNVDKDIIFVDGTLPDYFFVRFEHLHDDLEALCLKIGIPYDAEKLPKKKVGIRKDSDYKSLYDEETIEIVKKAYRQEVDKFNYTF